MKLISLSQGKFAKVDDHLFDYFNQWKWHFDGKYARRNVYHYENGKRVQTHILMHRIVNRTSKGRFTDHIDGDALNNQKNNLRTCIVRQNAANMKKRANQSSRYKGVTKRGEIASARSFGKTIGKSLMHTSQTKDGRLWYTTLTRSSFSVNMPASIFQTR